MKIQVNPNTRPMNIEVKHLGVTWKVKMQMLSYGDRQNLMRAITTNKIDEIPAITFDLYASKISNIVGYDESGETYELQLGEGENSRAVNWQDSNEVKDVLRPDFPFGEAFIGALAGAYDTEINKRLVEKKSKEKNTENG